MLPCLSGTVDDRFQITTTKVQWTRAYARSKSLFYMNRNLSSNTLVFKSSYLGKLLPGTLSPNEFMEHTAGPKLTFYGVEFDIVSGTARNSSSDLQCPNFPIRSSVLKVVGFYCTFNSTLSRGFSLLTMPISFRFYRRKIAHFLLLWKIKFAMEYLQRISWNICWCW